MSSAQDDRWRLLEVPWRNGTRPKQLKARRRNRLLHLAWERQQGACYWCKRSVPYEMTTLEHVIPLVLGGLDRLWNTAAVHGYCNSGRVPQWHEIKPLLVIALPKERDQILSLGGQRVKSMVDRFRVAHPPHVKMDPRIKVYLELQAKMKGWYRKHAREVTRCDARHGS